MKRATIMASMALLLTLAGTAHADHLGTITNFHLDSTVTGRGVCIQMTPAIPGKWACLYKDNALYTEIHGTLLGAYLGKRGCKLFKKTERIESVECY